MKKKFIPLVLLWSVLTFFPACGSAQQVEEVLTIPVGKLEVVAIRDALGSMEAKLLPDLANYPELLKLFEHGPLPAVNNVYFLKIDGKNVLIDTGWGKEQPEKQGSMLQSLATLGVAPTAINDILLTHMDFDHIGGLTQAGKPVFPNATLWIAKPEYEAWLRSDIQKRPQEKIALAQKIAEIYKDHLKLFEFGQEILPGIKAVNATGHTPGHTAYDITSGNETLTIAGDIMHISSVQLLNPKLSTIYDMDMQKAAESRAALLKRAATTGSQLGGMHFPMVSPVKQREDGGFNMREPR